MMLLTALAIAAVGAAPASAATVTPIQAGSIALSPIAVNTQAGDQFNSHVAPDLVVYSDPSQIHTYRFSTSTHAVVTPGANAIDLLSDVQGEQVVFTRAFSGGRRAQMYFDGSALTELEPNIASNRFGSAVGSDTIAWVDYALESHGELIAYERSTATATRLTNDTLGDQNPQVSVDGTVIAWEHCLTSILNCDIWTAVRTAPGAWTVGIASNTSNAESNPDTDGSVATWESRSGATWDIVTQPVGSSTPTTLSIAGEETNPSMSGDAILFEHRNDPSSATDLFVYERSSNRSFQLTATAAVNETLSDIVAIGANTYRITWTADEDGFDERNVYAATFTIPPVATAYNFNGFFSPVDDDPTPNIVNAGRSVPVKFSLGGDQGLDIFAPNSPASTEIGCDSSEEGDQIEQTVIASTNSLSYDPLTDRYTYVWKTLKAWKGTCRMFALTLDDGTTHLARFSLR